MSKRFQITGEIINGVKRSGIVHQPMSQIRDRLGVRDRGGDGRYMMAYAGRCFVGGGSINVVGDCYMGGGESGTFRYFTSVNEGRIDCQAVGKRMGDDYAGRELNQTGLRIHFP
mgnify:CR=1 FL=1